LQPVFLSGDAGQRFCLFYPASGGVAHGALIHIHPFAEEMNKSRRIVAIQSRALALAGYDVLQIDLAGCGDSEGDFVDANWQVWLADVLLAYRWLRGRSSAPLTLWGVRLGCLLAVDVAEHLPEPANFLFWQPVILGRLHWQQFLRLKWAGELLGGEVKGVVKETEDRVAAGLPVEVAGYTVSARLARSILQSELRPAFRTARLTWLEVSRCERADLPAPSRQAIDCWLAAGFAVDAVVVHGVPFWQTTEIEEVPTLVEATLASLKRNL